jgi:cytoskeleton protein RodZ
VLQDVSSTWTTGRRLILHAVTDRALRRQLERDSGRHTCGEVVFEIGSRLREARKRRGLGLAAVERDTRIRARWLTALEEERFDLLPERPYAIGFLRTYARYLGLEEQLFVDELSSRLPPEEAYEVLLPPWPARRRRVLGAWILAAAGLAAVAAIVIGLIGLGGSKGHTVSPPAQKAEASQRPAAHPVTRPPVRKAAERTPGPQLAKLLLAAARGRCWLDARLGSQNGRKLHLGTLEPGQSIRLRGARIWIRLGAPTALYAALNGKRVALPTTTPVTVIVTATGLRTVP